MTKQFKDPGIDEDIVLAMELAPTLPRDPARVERIARMLVVFSGMICGTINVPNLQAPEVNRAVTSAENVVALRLAKPYRRRGLDDKEETSAKRRTSGFRVTSVRH